MVYKNILLVGNKRVLENIIILSYCTKTKLRILNTVDIQFPP